MKETLSNMAVGLALVWVCGVAYAVYLCVKTGDNPFADGEYEKTNRTEESISWIMFLLFFVVCWPLVVKWKLEDLRRQNDIEEQERRDDEGQRNEERKSNGAGRTRSVERGSAGEDDEGRATKGRETPGA